MTTDQRLSDHEGHALSISIDQETLTASLECNTCGEYIIEQESDGSVLWN